MSHFAGMRGTAVAAAACAASLVLAARAPGQALPGSASDSGSQEQVPVEVFTAPRPMKIAKPDCDVGGSGALRRADACEELLEGNEGWVTLGLMVDPSGKPYEVTVISSTGNRTFERVATKAIEQSTFEPASLNGKPIESGYELKYKFVNGKTPYSGAKPEFVSAYRALLAAINAGDQAAADAAMKNLKITNLYEDAYFGLATYDYASKWGDESQQLAGLRRAIAGEDRAQYLPVDTFRSALLACMKAELKARLYAEAMDTWNRLEKSGVANNTAAQLKPIIEQLEKLRSDDSAYAVHGQMPEGRWYLHLFKRHFQIVVREGSLSDVRLRCDRRYVFFAFDPTLTYQVANKDGSCSIELEGTPGTRFDLVQS